jgi:hypothetical protein
LPNLGYLEPRVFKDTFPLFSTGKVMITDTYHKFWGLTRIGDTMALSLLLAGQQYHNIWKKADSFR